MAEPKKSVLLLIDVHALIHRFFHALPPLTTPEKEPIGAIYGLCGIVVKIIRDQKPDYIAACFDRPEPTFRDEMFKEYKAQRAPAVDELISQIKRTREVFEIFGIKGFEKAGFEADDLIGTLAEKFKKETGVLILSGDNDLLQLVDDANGVRAQLIKTGLSETVTYDEKAVEEKYGLKPIQLPDYKALVGDTSDNIPGVNGVGPKTAQPLIKEFGTVEELFKSLGIIPEKTAKKFAGQEEIALLSKKLAIIRRDAPIEAKLEELKTPPLDKAKITAYFEKLGFRTLVERMNKNG